MECPPTRAQAWLDEHARDLDGLAADDAAALVEGAGLQLRILPLLGGWLTQEERGDRITLRLDADDHVRTADAG